MTTSIHDGIGRAAVMLLAASLISSSLSAHGGQYRGPGDIVPPGAGSGPGGVRGSGPGGPSGPGGSGGAGGAITGSGGGGAAGPGPGGAAPGTAPGFGPRTGAGGLAFEDDLSRWQFWWEFNKDPFLRLKEAVHSEGVATGGDEYYMGNGRRQYARETRRPTDDQIERQVLPALKRLIDGTEQNDIVSSVLVAMAKVGRDHPDFGILPVMAGRLRANSQEVRETAALAMGISQMVPAVDDYLLALVEDGPAGRGLVGGGRVDYRTRSFAAYGLGLVAWATSDVDVKARCFAALRAVLEDGGFSGRDVRVAAIHGLSLLAPDPTATGGKEQALFEDVLAVLEGYFERRLGAGDELIQAHAPTAIAKLVGRDGPPELVTRYRDLFLDELTARGPSRRGNDIVRSAALALGQLCAPDRPAADCSAALLEYFRSGKDQQARYFSLIAVAQIGGHENRNELLKVLRRGNTLERPWAALALGVYAHRAHEAARAAGLLPDPDPLIGEALRRALRDTRNPDNRAALAVGLGLARYREAADDLRHLLIENRQRDQLAGYLCIGLALMGDAGSKEDITDIVATSVRRPGLLGQAAVALGKLGDKRATDLLQEMMVEGEQNLAKMSALASALGYIGDHRSIDPLLHTMFDTGLTDLTRAFAAVAVGGVADKEPLPWNSKISVDINYRAATETLTGGGLGVLDIL